MKYELYYFEICCIPDNQSTTKYGLMTDCHFQGDFREGEKDVDHSMSPITLATHFIKPILREPVDREERIRRSNAFQLGLYPIYFHFTRKHIFMHPRDSTQNGSNDFLGNLLY